MDHRETESNRWTLSDYVRIGSKGRSVRCGNKDGAMLKEVNEPHNNLDSQLREAVVLKKVGFFSQKVCSLYPFRIGKGGNT
jgi:hypothetical protein